VRIAIFVLIFVFGINATTMALLLLGIEFDPNTRVIEPSLGIFSLGIIELLVTIATTALFWHVFEKRNWSQLGVRLEQTWSRYLLVGVCVAVALSAVLFFTGFTVGWVEITGISFDTERLIFTLVFLLVMASAEELLFRGYILQSLERSSGMIMGVAVSSFLYGLMHLGNPEADLMAFIGIVAHGIFLCIIFLASRSLWLPIGFHWMWNVAQGVVFGLPVSGYSFERILQSKLIGTSLFYSPSGFGPEAGLFSVLCLFVIGVGLIGLMLPKIKTTRGKSDKLL
jgi:membrane protease YdiL (CAAX protease family)